MLHGLLVGVKLDPCTRCGGGHGAGLRLPAWSCPYSRDCRRGVDEGREGEGSTRLWPGWVRFRGWGRTRLGCDEMQGRVINESTTSQVTFDNVTDGTVGTFAHENEGLEQQEREMQGIVIRQGRLSRVSFNLGKKGWGSEEP